MIYQKGYEFVTLELDIIQIVNTIHKLKAGICAVISTD